MKQIILISLLQITLVSLYASDKHNNFELSDSTNSSSSNSPHLFSNGKEVRLNGRTLDEYEVSTIFGYDPYIYYQYESGVKLRRTGLTLLGAGIIGTSTGFILMLTGINYNTSAYGSSTPTYTTQYYVGYLLMIFSEFFIPPGIMLNVMGKNKIKNSVDRHNQNTLGQYNNTKAKIEFGMVSTGLGLRVTF